MTDNRILSRRNAIQSFTLIGAAFGLCQITSCNQDSLQAQTKSSKQLSPFYIPPSNNWRHQKEELLSNHWYEARKPMSNIPVLNSQCHQNRWPSASFTRYTG